MCVYLGFDRYNEVLDLYEHTIHSFRELAISDLNVKLLVSAVYAEFGDLDKYLVYLEKDFTINEIYPGIEWNITQNSTFIEVFPTISDMLYALYELIFPYVLE